MPAKKKSTRDILRSIAGVAFSLDFAKDPKSAYETWSKAESNTAKAADKVMDIYNASLMEQAALVAGVDVKEMANPDKRTYDLDLTLRITEVNQGLKRLKRFIENNYMQALGVVRKCAALDEEHGNYMLEENTADDYSIHNLIAMYYFATHDDIEPIASASFTEANEQDVKAVYEEITDYLQDYLQDKTISNATIQEGFMAFLEAVPAADLEKLETLLSHTAKDHIIPANKLANLMTEDVIDAGRISISVLPKTAAKQIETLCVFSCENDSNVTISGKQRLTEFDRNVFNGVCSLYAANTHHEFTTDQIFRATVGLSDQEKPTAAQKAAVTRAMDKMRFIRAQIDFTEEFKHRKIYTLEGLPIEKGGVDTYFIAANNTWVVAGGRRVKAYTLLEKPVIYAYAEALGQVITVPMELMDVKRMEKGIPSTRSLPYSEQRVAIKGYLMRRIQELKNAKNNMRNPCIAFNGYSKGGTDHDGLYQRAGYATPTKKQALDIRNDAAAILEYWQATGLIKGFEFYKDGKTIAGIRVIV